MSFKNIESLFQESSRKADIIARKEELRKQRKLSNDPYADRVDNSLRDTVIQRVAEKAILDDRVPVIQSQGKVSNIENVVYYENGKRLKPEDCFKGAGYGLYIASLFRMYHDKVGYEDSDLNKFTTVILEAIRLFGPDVRISDQVVGACSYHMEVMEISPPQALREARVSIKDNVPREVFADMIIGGDAGMVADTVTGSVVIADDKGLSKKATKAMGSLFQAKIAPREQIVAVVCDLTKTNLEFVEDLKEEVVRWVETQSVPDIVETQPYRSLSNVPGLLSSSPVAPGNQGLYQNMCKYIRAVDKTKPDIIFVPGNNQAMNGSYDSLGDCSRAVPLPEDLMQASPLLASVNVSPFDKVIAGLRMAEIAVEKDDSMKHDHSMNARSFYHGQFEEDYVRYLHQPHGVTKLGLKYVTLYGHKPVVAQELTNLFNMGALDDNPVIMRASEYNLATLKGVKGNFVITDLAAMIGLFMTEAYVAAHVDSKFIGKDKRLKPVSGFYVLKDLKTGSVNVYSTWIEKYILAKMLDVLYPDQEFGRKVLEYFISYTSSGKKRSRNAALVKNTVTALLACYGKVKVDPDKILSLAPNYSMKKALKHTKIMLEGGYLETFVDQPEQSQDSEDSFEEPPVPDPVIPPHDDSSHDSDEPEEIVDIEDDDAYEEGPPQGGGSNATED